MLNLKNGLFKKKNSTQKNIIIELATQGAAEFPVTGGLKHTVSLKVRGEQEER